MAPERAEGPADPGEAVPWHHFLDEAAERLSRRGVASPAVDARRIVEEASGHEGAELATHLDEPATTRGVARFDAMLARREQGEPLQYVLGRWGFRRLDLLVDRRVLIPRPETEALVGVALDELDRQADAATTMSAVDLGTGSGAIALSLAVERVDVEVTAVERSSDALVVARSNLAGVGRQATRVRMVEGDWFDALEPDRFGELHLVVSNPPYVAEGDDLPAEVADWEPIEALVAGPSGLEAAEYLIDTALDWLRPGGALVLELAPDQLTHAADQARGRGYGDIVVGRDLVGRDRVLRARRPPA